MIVLGLGMLTDIRNGDIRAVVAGGFLTLLGMSCLVITLHFQAWSITRT